MAAVAVQLQQLSTSECWIKTWSTLLTSSCTRLTLARMHILSFPGTARTAATKLSIQNLCVQQVALLNSATYDPANFLAQADVKVSKVNSAGARPAASGLFRLNSKREYLPGRTCRQHMQGVPRFGLRSLTAKDLTRLVFVSDRRPQVQKLFVI